MQLKENRSGSLFVCREIQKSRFSTISQNRLLKAQIQSHIWYNI